MNTANWIEWSIYWFRGYEDEINWVLPYFRKHLMNNIQLNGFDDVEVLSWAISTMPGERHCMHRAMK